MFYQGGAQRGTQARGAREAAARVHARGSSHAGDFEVKWLGAVQERRSGFCRRRSRVADGNFSSAHCPNLNATAPIRMTNSLKKKTTKKQDFTKPKLKVGKKLVPQNATDTSHKSKGMPLLVDILF
jgi:hypothetical protein